MDPKDFEQRVIPLGRIKRKYGGSSSEGFEDTVFVPLPSKKSCNDCGKVVVNRTILIEKRVNGQNKVYWRKKCGICKETFTGFDL